MHTQMDNPQQQVAMYSCDVSREAVKNSWHAGTVEFIEKAMPPADFAKLIESFCNKYETVCQTIRPNKDKSENRRLLESVKMTGQSQIMVNLALTIKKLAASPDTSVLIRGESGTGKELVARALHDLSPRANGPFVAINCGAIPENLLESELFGHLKGSFTGAASTKIGKFAVANNGTLFLDEIGEMPLQLQVKLLRVLQERSIEPVGATSPQKINVRVITATHCNLEDMVAKGKFREDLMYRIKVVECKVPPLRSRVEDIEPLIEQFTTAYNEKNDTKKFFQRRTLDVLKRYPWPGNVRELQGSVEKHFVMSSESAIRPEDLDPKLYEASPAIVSGLTFDDYRRRRAEDDLRFYECVIEECGGSKAAAARRLNISANHLQHLINAAIAPVADGYRYHFGKDTPTSKNAYLSIGKNLEETRFYFADAAISGLYEKWIDNMNEPNFILVLENYIKLTHSSIRAFVVAYLHERGIEVTTEP